MGTLHDTADAVRAVLAAGSFTKSATPIVSYDTELPLDEANTIRVDVVAAGMTSESESRISLRYNVLIDVAVRFKFDPSTQIFATGKIGLSHIEGFVDYLEELAEHLAKPANRALTGKTDATWLRNEIRAPWIPEHIREHRQYTGILRATYYVAKDLT